MTELETSTVWPTDGLSFGGDYNPEQWPREVWDEDIKLMLEAGVNLVTLGVFSWGLVEVGDADFRWGWFDDIIGLLHGHGIAIDLATPTAAPPIWLLAKHPEMMRVDADGRPEPPGVRLGWCPSSATFRSYGLRITKALAQRYGRHPAVRLWHVSNELGGHNGRCYCDVSKAAFHRWLRRKYATIDVLNAAWGTAFWGHRLGSFEEVYLPKGSQVAHNPALHLDFERFSSEELLDYFFAEKEVIEQYSSVTVTTNLMVNTRDVVDYPRWAEHLPIVANDHYLVGTDPHSEEELAFSADRMRGMSRGRQPWMLMEHSTGSTTWQEHNRAKNPGELIRNSLAHVARGSDAAMFFQWRASSAGAEQFHSAMVPHTGTNTKIWREVVELGHTLRRLHEIQGSKVEEARVAILYDTEADWAYSRGLKPAWSRRYAEEPTRWHRALHRRNVLVDVIAPWHELAGYQIIIVPTLFLVSDEDARRIAQAAAAGATVVIGYLSGIVDSDDRVRLGGYPGAFRELIGASSEEFFPLLPSAGLKLDNGWEVRHWSEWVNVTDAEIVAAYADGPLTGRPAITRRDVSSGSAWYVSAGLSDSALGELTGELVANAGISAVADVPSGIEAVRRVGPDKSYLFLLNHTDEDLLVRVDGYELVTDSRPAAELLIPAGKVRVVRQ